MPFVPHVPPNTPLQVEAHLDVLSGRLYGVQASSDDLLGYDVDFLEGRRLRDFTVMLPSTDTRQVVHIVRSIDAFVSSLPGGAQPSVRVGAVLRFALTPLKTQWLHVVASPTSFTKGRVQTYRLRVHDFPTEVSAPEMVRGQVSYVDATGAFHVTSFAGQSDWPLGFEGVWALLAAGAALLRLAVK